MKTKLTIFLIFLCNLPNLAQVTSTLNTVFGTSAGGNISSGTTTIYRNAYFGSSAGQSATGNENTFFGWKAGAASSNSGSANTFIGSEAGLSNTSGYVNVFIGQRAGIANTTGLANVFLGPASGAANVTGSYNLFMGNGTGTNATGGNGNVFIGDGAGYGYTFANALAADGNNTYIGRWAGFNANSGGTNNTFIGCAAGTPQNSPSITNATAIGYGALVTTSNTMILGATGPNSVSVGIGVSNPKYMLTVNGIVGAREVNVTTESWSDFVFEKTYKLPSLTAVERAIQQDHHLPDIPSANEVEANGVNVGQMQAKLLQKIEELTLYVIQQQKRIVRLEKKLANFQRVR